MNNLQQKLFTLLLEIDDICNRHDITYYLAGGTALGAVRGGKVLPWDDDADIYITRDNWEKLKPVMEKELPEGREFACVENTPLYNHPIGAYYDSNSTLILRQNMLIGKACGQMVEFLIMDPMPTDDQGKWNHRRWLKVYTELLSPYIVINGKIREVNVDYDYELYQEYYERMKEKGREKILAEVKEKFTQASEEEADTFCMRWGIETLMYPKSGFGTPRRVKMEGKMLPVGEHAERIFRIAYGDGWMYVPVPDEKVIHRRDIDVDIPYKRYTDIFLPLIDREEILQAHEVRKRNITDVMPNREAFEWEMAKLRGEAFAVEIVKEPFDAKQMATWLESQEFDKLEAFYKPFYQFIKEKYVKRNAIIPEAEEEYLYYALMTPIMKGEYYRIMSVISILERKQRIVGTLEKAAEAAHFCWKLSVAMYDEKDNNQVKAILDEGKQWDNLRDYQKAVLWLLKEETEKLPEEEERKEQLTKLYEKAFELSRHFVMDGEILGYMAYAKWMLGFEEEAKGVYETAVSQSRNGFLWKEAEELAGVIHREKEEYDN